MSRIPRRIPKTQKERVMMGFTDSLLNIYDRKLHALSMGWQNQVKKIDDYVKEISGEYDNICDRARVLKFTLLNEIEKIKTENENLRRRVNEYKREKETKNLNIETIQMQQKSEYDLEISLNNKFIELTKNKADIERIRLKTIFDVKNIKKSIQKNYVKIIALKQSIKENKLKMEINNKQKMLMMREAAKEKSDETRKGTSSENIYKTMMKRAGFISEHIDEPTDRELENDRYVIEQPVCKCFSDKAISTLLATGNYSRDEKIVQMLIENKL